MSTPCLSACVDNKNYNTNKMLNYRKIARIQRIIELAYSCIVHICSEATPTSVVMTTGRTHHQHGRLWRIIPPDDVIRVFRGRHQHCAVDAQLCLLLDH